MPATKKTVKRFSSSKSQSGKSKNIKYGSRLGMTKKQILIFVLLFAVIGSVLLWWSLASTGVDLNYTNLDTAHSSNYTVVTETTGSKRNHKVVQLAAASPTNPSEASFFYNSFSQGLYQVCLIAKNPGGALPAVGSIKVFNYNGGPVGSAIASTIYSAPASIDYKSASCIAKVTFTASSPGMEVTVSNMGPLLKVGSVIINKTAVAPPPHTCHPGDPLYGVLDPGRLGVTKTCQTITGIICQLEFHEGADGDNAFDIIVDSQYKSLLNSNNINQCASVDSRLALHLETIPQNQADPVFHSPNAETLALKVGDYISATGPLVQDNGHGNPGWTEIHPVEFVDVITPAAALGNPIQASPPIPSAYREP